MKKGWIYAEKIIAGFLILLGIAGLVVIFYYYIAMINKLDKSWQLYFLLNPWYFLKSYHTSFISNLLLVFGGIALLLNKRIGWVTATSGLLLLICNHIRNIVIDSYEMQWTINGILNHILFILPLLLLILTALIILIQQPYRTKYHVNAKTWLFVILIAALFFSEPYIYKLLYLSYQKAMLFIIKAYISC